MRELNIRDVSVRNVTPWGEEQLYIVAVVINGIYYYFNSGSRREVHQYARELRARNIDTVVIRNY